MSLSHCTAKPESMEAEEVSSYAMSPDDKTKQREQSLSLQGVALNAFRPGTIGDRAAKLPLRHSDSKS